MMHLNSANSLRGVKLWAQSDNTLSCHHSVPELI